MGQLKESLNTEQECLYNSEDKTLTPAAVLIGLLDSGETKQDNNDFQILLTQRTDHLHHHPGQISLPGGRKDHVDDNPVQTALRETSEETGITEDYINVIGTLDEYPTVTGFNVMPVVARINSGFSLKPDPFEVEEIFFVPLRFILDQDNHQRHEYIDRNRPKKASFYYQIDYQNRRIWGVTAAILINFYKRLKDNYPLFSELMPQMTKQGLRNR